jgi:hypothetical protein
MEWLFWPLMWATKPTPQASCSWAGSYRPRPAWASNGRPTSSLRRSWNAADCRAPAPQHGLGLNTIRLERRQGLAQQAPDKPLHDRTACCRGASTPRWSASNVVMSSAPTDVHGARHQRRLGRCGLSGPSATGVSRSTVAAPGASTPPARSRPHRKRPSHSAPLRPWRRLNTAAWRRPERLKSSRLSDSAVATGVSSNCTSFPSRPYPCTATPCARAASRTCRQQGAAVRDRLSPRGRHCGHDAITKCGKFATARRGWRAIGWARRRSAGLSARRSTPVRRLVLSQAAKRSVMPAT